METRCKDAAQGGVAGPVRAGAVLVLMALASVGIVPSASAADPRQQSRAGAEPLPPADPDVWLRRLVGNYSVEGTLEVVYLHPDYDKHRCAPLPPDPQLQDDPLPEPEPFCRSIKGAVDCTGVGKGPGVQCVFGVVWPDLFQVVHPSEDPVDPGVFNIPGGVANLSPAMALFGLDPGESAIRYLLVDSKGLPEGGLGYIAGNRATFTTPCVNAPTLLAGIRPETIEDRVPTDCDRVIRFDAKPDSRIVNMSVDIKVNGAMFTSMLMTLRRREAAAAAVQTP